jgi:phytanoyl-CoA hydroxylase
MDLNTVKADFERDGYVKLGNILNPAELSELRNETGRIVEEGWEGKQPAHHYFHAPDACGGDVFHRVQFIFPKALRRPNPFLALLGHPRLLDVVAKLHEGFHSGLSGEALVFKTPRNGRAVPLHTDGAEWNANVTAREIFFNVDVYLDDSTPENGCLLAVPGSHRRPSREMICQGFDLPGLVEVPAAAGDVIVHNTRVIHGSRTSRSPSLRRTIYYEFRTLEWMASAEHAQLVGKTQEQLRGWIEARARLLQHAIALRKSCAYAADEPKTSFRIPDHCIATADDELDLAPNFGGSYF